MRGFQQEHLQGKMKNDSKKVIFHLPPRYEIKKEWFNRLTLIADLSASDRAEPKDLKVISELKKWVPCIDQEREIYNKILKTIVLEIRA